jgi:hypothetical protein
MAAANFEQQIPNLVNSSFERLEKSPGNNPRENGNQPKLNRFVALGIHS